MSYTLPNSQLLAPLFSDATISRIFSDEQFVQNMLTVEGVLAEVQGTLGIIPATAVTPIQQGITTFQPDLAQLQKGIEKAGVPVAELVQQLRHHVGQPAADYIHWGATTQDIMDTAVILQIREACTYLETILRQTIQQLGQLADQHRHTLMAGRTHSQQALPITFGLKAAGWATPLLRHQQRLQILKPHLLSLQFGGAAGTLAAFGDEGLTVQTALADALSLSQLATPWHTQRDNLAELGNWLSLVTGSLAKMGQDIILLAQTEVGELRESSDTRRGGSSTMPQKSNPVISEGIIALARMNANHLAVLHQALIQENERGTHGWQLEWLTLPHMFMATAVSLNKALYLSQHLDIDTKKMRQNITTSQGLLLAEAVSLALTPTLGRAQAKQLVAQACQQALAEDRHLVDVLKTQTAVALNWDFLREESNYLGITNQLIDQVLEEIK